MRDKKRRADQLLVEQGLAPTRAKAQGLILAGIVSCAGQRVEKPGEQIAAGAALYATALATMWLASGRPEGPERQALRVVLRWSKRLVRQDARS